MLDYITCGESHGQCLVTILEGMPSGISISRSAVDKDLARRQQGYGRGSRMHIEHDRIVITAGVIKGKTTGAPLGLMLINKGVTINELPELTRPRPGHADFAGALKYDQNIRAVLERSSARETALRVAVGSVCKRLLAPCNIGIASHVVRIGSHAVPNKERSLAELNKYVRNSQLNCCSRTIEKKMLAEIKRAAKRGDTLGGEVEIIVTGVPVGLGSYVHHRRKLDGRIAQGLMSIQAVKAVQFGLGTAYAAAPGSRVHDELFYTKRCGYFRKTNHAGGIEGGMSNGSSIVVRATMKPIATLKKSLRSVDFRTRKASRASFERSDVCAVPSCSVISEAVVAYEIACALLEKFGGDSLREVRRNMRGYLRQIK